jgi:hypothetical protein
MKIAHGGELQIRGVPERDGGNNRKFLSVEYPTGKIRAEPIHDEWRNEPGPQSHGYPVFA